jgi:hypothetical protein
MKQKLKDIDPNEIIRQARKSELDRRGVPKAFKAMHNFKHRNFRGTNYFYRLFDHIGKQLAEANIKDKAENTSYPFSKKLFLRAWDFAR